MVNLIKSDLYAQLKQLKVYVYVMIFALVYIISSSIGNYWEYTGNMEIVKLTNLVLKQQFMVIFMIIIGVTSYYIGKLFSNKFIQLQVISCKARQKVLFSKYFVQSVINVVIVTLVFGGALVALNFIYGVDYEKIGAIFLRWGVLVILIIRFSIIMVSLVFMTKHGVVAALSGWIIFVVQSLPFLIGMEYQSNVLLRISKLFATGQIYTIAAEDIIGTNMIFWILFTTIVEMGVYIILAYKKFRKAELV